MNPSCSRVQVAVTDVLLQSDDPHWGRALQVLEESLDRSGEPRARGSVTVSVGPYGAPRTGPTPATRGQWEGRRFLPDGDDRYESRSIFWRAVLNGFDHGTKMEARFELLEDQVSPDQVEGDLRAMLAVVACPALVHQGGLLVHGCAMAHPSGAYANLFLGPSGAGKSTMTRRLPGWTPLSDDVVFVDLSTPTPHISGTLLPGKEHLPRRSAPHPLSAVFSLSPGTAHLDCSPQDRAQAFSMWMERILWYMPEGPLVGSVMNLVERLAHEVPAFTLGSSLCHDLMDLVEVRP